MKRQISTGNQITEGVIWKQLLFFFFPILLGTFFQQFYNTIDMVIVGRFVGKEALASVGGSAGQITDDIRNVQPEIQDDRDDQADQRGEISRQGDGVPCIRAHCDTFSLNALAMASSAA